MHLPNGADKRERILAVAEELFFQYSFLGTTLEMICAALRTTKPFVYYYFKNKQEIFETITWRGSVAVMTAMKFPADDMRPAHVKLAEGLHRFMAACVANFRSGALAYRDTASLRPQFQAKLRRLARYFYADLCTIMEQGRADGKLSFEDTMLTARAMVSVGAFMYAWYAPAGRVPPDEIVRALTSILFKMVGLRAKPMRVSDRLRVHTSKTR
ncbi:MAG: TetR/AcrR family transcriptional regulator [Betaproteobacteria bacterium]|nr:TetR/AcrR family transcriptional regulator [Betaproteobacteria bacterium]